MEWSLNGTREGEKEGGSDGSCLRLLFVSMDSLGIQSDLLFLSRRLTLPLSSLGFE